MKYKAGDRVKIRDDLQTNVQYGTHYFIPEMKEYEGEIVTITKVIGNSCLIDKDGEKWCWTDEMFEPAKLTKADLQPRDILIDKKGMTYYLGDKKGIYLCTAMTIEKIEDEEKLLSETVEVLRLQTIWKAPVEKTNEELHREMWNWLAENPDKRKFDWIKNHAGELPNKLSSMCFACEECGTDCDKCPLDANVTGCGARGYEGLYDAWALCEDRETRARLARVIANLP